MSTVHVSAIQHELLLGSWRNTNSCPRLIQSLLITEKAGVLWLQVSGADELAPGDWGEREMREFSDSPESGMATAFTAVFDSNAIRSTLQAYVVKGVLVIVAMTRFEQEGRSNLFTKEFFYRLPGNIEETAV